jgi:ABC-type lipoprotein export system ATPase subunit
VALLRTVARERQAAVVLVTHDSDAAQLADRRFLLHDGQLAPAEQPADTPRLTVAPRSQSAGG